MNELLQDLAANWWLYALIPFISAGVGFCTNLMALKMMFLPMEFVGIGKIGWQGIVPRKAATMAGIAVETMTGQLISTEEIFERLDPERIANELEAPLNEMVEDVVDEVMRAHQPALWAAMPKIARNRVIKRVKDEAPDLIKEIMEKVKSDIDEVFDLKEMVITNLMRDKQLLNRIFLDVGEPEFKFVARSGAYFGFMFGLVQMLVWIFYKGDWVLPAFGLLVGYATNWIALKMIFEPQEPKRVGLIKIQGLFLKRQKEVAEQYGDLIAAEILTPAHIIEAILKGPSSDRLFALIARNVKNAVDDQTGLGLPFVTMTIGTKKYNAMKNTAVESMVEKLPRALRQIEDYAEDAMDIRNTLKARMADLTPTQFERMLRPAFEQDEWILITVGALLGMAAGFAQLIFMFGGGS